VNVDGSAIPMWCFLIALIVWVIKFASDHKEDLEKI
jgi:hypothetical protein